MNLYKTKRWLIKSKHILRADEYLCQLCKRQGKNTEAQMVHHIKPVEINPELAYENNNLISLCNKCHNKCHDRNNDKLTKFGKSVSPPRRKTIF